MANFFDKFDDAAPASGNPFDQFDEPTKPTQGGFAPREAREQEYSRDDRKAAYREMARGVRERQSAPVRYADTAMRGLARAVPFMNEASAGLNYLTGTGDSYEDALDRERAMSDVDDTDRTALSVGTQMAGMLAMPGSGWAASGRLGSRLAKSGVLGGVYGGVYGAGDGDTAGERATNALEGAKTGALFGLGGAGLFEAGRGAVGAIGALSAPIRGYRQPVAEAERRIAAGLGQDRAVGGRLLDDADYAAAAAAGQDPMLIDRGGATIRAMARDARNTSPEAAQQLEGALAGRARDQNEAAGDFLSRLFSPLRSPNPEATIERLQRRAQAANSANYSRAEQAAENLISPGGRINPAFPDGLMTPVLDRLAQSPLVQSAMQRSLNTGMNDAALRGFRVTPPTNPFVRTDQGYVLRPPGPNGERTLPTLAYWDQVQRNLRAVARKAKLSGDDNLARQANGMRSQLISHLDEILPEYQTARQGAARFFGAEDALEAGENFFSMTKRGDIAKARQAMQRMSPAERGLFAEGYLAAAEAAARARGDGQTASRIKVWNSPADREKLELAVGPRRAREALAYRDRAEILEWSNNAVRGNSSTVMQLASLGLAGGVSGAYMTGDMSGGMYGAMVAPLVKLGMQGIKGRVDDRVSRELARLLTSTNPATHQRIISRSQNQQQLTEALNHIASTLPKLSAPVADEVNDRRREPIEIEVKKYADGGMVDSMAGFLPPDAAEPMREEQGPSIALRDPAQIPELDPWQTEKAIGRGAVEAAGTAGRYLRDTPLSQIPSDVGKVGGMMWEGIKEDPMGAVLDVLPGVGQVRAAMDADELAAKAAEAEAAGDSKMASELRQFATLAAAGVIPGAGLAGKGAKKAAKTAVTAGDAVVDAEHAMGIERGQRATINPSSVRLTDAEKAIVNSLETPSLQAKAATAIRAKKANYPPSAGWEPMEVKSVSFDEKTGEPVLEWKSASYGFNRGNFDVERTVTDPSGAPLKQPKLDAAGNPVLDADGNPVMTNRNVKETVKENFAPRRGTPEHTRLINKIVRGSMSEIRDIIRRANEGDEAAQVILRQAGWYRETMRKGFDERGGAYPAFADLLGGTSPNTSVDQNYAYSVDLQKRFARGDFDDDVAFTRDYQGNLNEFPEERLLRRNDAFDETGTGKQYGMNSRNAAMALADRWREEVPGQAPKARNFSGNLGGQTDKATIDLWAARFVNRMAGRKRLPPALEAGVGGSLGADLRAGGEFGFGQDVFAKLSDELNKSGELQPFLQQLGYNDVTPMDLQALTWFIEKEHWGRNGWTTKAGEGGSFEDEMRKFPTERWQSGFSVQQAEPPTDDVMLTARRAVEAPLKTDDSVRVFRVNPTYGRYAGTNERSFDVELSAKPGWDPRQWMAAVIDQAKQNNQYDVFFSRRLGASDAAKNPNARPGAEIYFKSRQEMEKILPMLEEFTNRGADGFTFVTDLKLRERLAGGKDVPDYVGVRLQFVPEITARWDDGARDTWVNDPKALQAAMADAAERMQQALNAIGSKAEVVDARLHFYDTLTVGRESYDNFLAGIADPDGAAGVFEGSARPVDPLKRFGQPVHSHVEGRNRALRKGAAGGAQDDGGAVSGMVGGDTVPLTKAKGGRVKAKKRSRPLDQSDDALHEYLMATAAPQVPRPFAMGGPVFPAAVNNRIGALSRRH